MPTLTKLYTMQDASEHNTKDDCWVVIDGKVYDVTSYLDEHPGGDDVVVEVTGKDATDEFEDAGHSREARELLKDFFIGELDPSPTAAPEHKTSPQKKFSEDIAQKLNDSMMQYWAVPAGIICVSLVAGLIFLRKKSTS